MKRTEQVSWAVKFQNFCDSGNVNGFQYKPCVFNMITWMLKTREGRNLAREIANDKNVRVKR